MCLFARLNQGRIAIRPAIVSGRNNMLQSLWHFTFLDLTTKHTPLCLFGRFWLFTAESFTKNNFPNVIGADVQPLTKYPPQFFGGASLQHRHLWSWVCDFKSEFEELLFLGFRWGILMTSESLPCCEHWSWVVDKLHWESYMAWLSLRRMYSDRIESAWQYVMIYLWHCTRHILIQRCFNHGT